MRKLLILAGWLLLAGFTPAWAAGDHDSQFFDQSLGNLKDELQAAKDAGKKGILLFFEMDECPFCARMKQTVFSQPQVQDYFKQHFLILPIDIEGDAELTDFTGKAMTSKEFSTKIHRVRATPVMIFVGLDGQVLYRYTGPTKDVEEFMLLGQFIVEGAYATQKFPEYRKQKQPG